MGRVFLGATLVLAALIGFSDRVVAQVNGNGAQTLRVFLDCGHRCDFDHFRREVPFVNYVRDRSDAQVHVLVTTQGTGGGLEMRFNFIGLQNFAGREDTLTYSSSATDSDVERRDGMVRIFKIGLMPFVVGTPLGRRIVIGYNAPAEGDVQTVESPETDPWNFWVFSTNLSGNLDGESTRHGFSVRGSFSANRTTEEWKINLNANGRYSRTTQELSEDTIVIIQRNYRTEVFAVRSINDHWSVGGVASAGHNRSSNRDLYLDAMAALEYNYFPYSESTRRQLTFLLTAGFGYNDWELETVFLKLSETRPEASLEVGYYVRQQWGNINMSVEGSAYLHDQLRHHRVDVNGGFDLRIVRGLSFYGHGGLSRIKNQIYLPLGDIPDDEILTNQRQLGTAFRYYGNFGLTYRFGSIFNNVVNPRMRGGDF